MSQTKVKHRIRRWKKETEKSRSIKWQEYMDTQEMEGRKLNIQTKNQTLNKSHSTSAVGYTPPKQSFICTSPTTEKSPTGGEVNGKLFI